MSHYTASFIIHFFILIPAHTIISSFGVPPCGCVFLYYMLKAQLPPPPPIPPASANSPQLAYSILIVKPFLHQEHTPHRECITLELWLPWYLECNSHTLSLTQPLSHNCTKSNVILERTAVTKYLYQLLEHFTAPCPHSAFMWYAVIFHQFVFCNGGPVFCAMQKLNC